MKLPEPSPDWQEIFRKDAGRIAQLLSAPEIGPQVKHVNDDYLPWEKAKYVKLPPGVSAEHLWVVVMVARSVKLQPIPLLDTKGTPFRFWLPDPVQRGLHLVDQKAGGASPPTTRTCRPRTGTAT